MLHNQDEEELEAIVIDSGSGTIKAGFSPNEAPQAVFPTCLGRPRPEIDNLDMSNKEFYVGNEAQLKREILNFSCPIEGRVVTNWEDMQIIWHHTFFNELKVAPEDYPVFVAEPISNRATDREKMCQIMFEQFHVPAFFISPQAVLSLYGCGRNSGTVLDSGDQVSHVVSVSESSVIPESVIRLDFAGRSLTEYLVKSLNERDFSVTTEIASDIKEKFCYVSQDLEQEIGSFSPSSEQFYTLPNGQTVTFGSELFHCSEALFRPSLLDSVSNGIHQAIFSSIMQCSAPKRNELCKNIVLAGGTTMLPGLAERLDKELRSLVPRDQSIKVVAPLERKYSSWLGGSIMASLTTFQPMWIPKNDYDECGSSIVHRKCF